MAAHRELKLLRLWITTGWLLVSAVVVVSLVPDPPGVLTVRFGDKIAHVLGYAVLMGWFVQIYVRAGTRALFAAGFIAMGMGLEFLQGIGPYRRFEYLDMVANTSGVLLAWALAPTWFSRLLLAVERRLI